MTQGPEKTMSGRDWLALFGVMLGAFMAVLDIQITNASLSNIAGALGSSVEEGSWISTAYLVAEIIVISSSGFFADVFSTKNYLLFSAIGFVVFSILCAFSTNLTMMIVFRACQGLTGGALIPLAFNVNLTLLPPSKQAIGTSIFGMTAIFGPAIGPTIGGFLTDNYGWQWIFFVNLVPGVAMTALIWIFLPGDRTKPEKLQSFDYIGIISMAVGLGSLEYVLEEGERKDWFGNELIQRFTWLAAIFIPVFLVRELTARRPFLNLRVFRDRNFALCCLLMTAQGVALYGSVYLLPLYLASVQKYSPTDIGLVMMWVGLPQLVIIPFLPRLLRQVDARLVIGAGVLVFAGSCFMNAFMSPDYAGPQLAVANVVRALGQPLVLIPILSLATSRTPRADAGSASALLNMLRNLGGSIGIAMLSTLTTWREHLHSVRIVSHLTPETLALQARIDQVQQLLVEKGLDPATAHRAALRNIGGAASTQASVMAYSDCFWVMGLVLLGSGAALFFLPKPVQRKGPAAAH